MSKTIYVVKSASGVYEDYREWNEKAFINESDAKEYALELNKRHNFRPDFITEEFIDAYDECYNNVPDWEEAPDYYLNEESWKKWQLEQINKERKFIIDEMYKLGFLVTEQMLDDYEQWESDSYNDWHDCSVEEIELI